MEGVWLRVEELCKERWGCVAPQRKLKGQPPESWDWVPLPHHWCHLFSVEHSPPYGIILREYNSPTILPCKIHALQESVVCVWHVDIWADYGGARDWVVWLWGQNPLLLWAWTEPLPHAGPSSPTLLSPSDPALLSLGSPGLSRILDKLSCMTLGQGEFFPHMPNWCRPFLPHGQILVCLGLINCWLHRDDFRRSHSTTMVCGH